VCATLWRMGDGVGSPDVEAPVLTDSVVVLRLAENRDEPAMTRALSEFDTVRWLKSVPHPLPPDESHRWVSEHVPNGWRTKDRFWFAIASPDDDAFLGEIGLDPVHLAQARAEVAYWLCPEARGKGLVRRALPLIIEWAVADLGICRFDWGAMVGNNASRAAAEAVGFKFEGTRRARLVRLFDGTRHDEWVMGLLSDDLLA
jgi:RimJ/RimL family protein N-acetyltransferase